MQAVAGQQPARRAPARADALGVLVDRLHPALDPLDAELVGPPGQCGLQLGAAHAEPGAGPKRVARNVIRADIRDPAEGRSRRSSSEAVEGGDGPGHQALAARLVDRLAARLDDRDGQPAASGFDGAGQTDRAGPCDQDVEVVHRIAAARARCSAGIRTDSTTALSRLKTIAVTQAVCTKGRAATSTTTAT